MRRLGLILGIALLAAGLRLAAMTSFAQLNVGTGAAVAFADATLNPTAGPAPVQALCSVATSPLRFRMDGGSPTASTGTVWVNSGDPIVIPRRDLLLNFKAISTGATSAVLDCNFW